MKEKNRFCWKLVHTAIDFEYRLYEDDFDPDASKYYAAGMYNEVADNIEFLTNICEIDVIENAKQFVEDCEGDVPLVTVWVSEKGYDPDPRIKDNGNFTSIPEE